MAWAMANKEWDWRREVASPFNQLLKWGKIEAWNRWRQENPEIKINLSGVDLYAVELTGANFENADLSNANLCDSDLSGANLSGAHLAWVQALGSNFSLANLTGACIEDWHINAHTNLHDVICDYVFIGHEYEFDGCSDDLTRKFANRRPHNPDQVFAPGEFAKRYQIVLETVELFFHDGIDWRAFVASLEEMKAKYGDELNIQGIERKAGGTFLVRLDIPPDADKGAVERATIESYEIKLKLLEVKYHLELQAKDREIEIYKRQSADLLELAKLGASKQPVVIVEANAVANSEQFTNKFDNTTIGNFANKVQDNARQQTNQHVYTSPEKQSLAEAALEIQKLLKVLEQTNPTATEAEKKAFATVAIAPDKRKRAVAALAAGAKAVVEEVLDNAYINIAIAIIEGWRDGG